MGATAGSRHDEAVEIVADVEIDGARAVTSFRMAAAVVEALEDRGLVVPPAPSPRPGAPSPVDLDAVSLVTDDGRVVATAEFVGDVRAELGLPGADIARRVADWLVWHLAHPFVAAIAPERELW